MSQHVKIEGLTNEAPARTGEVSVSLTHFKSDVLSIRERYRLKDIPYIVPSDCADHSASFMIGRDRDQTTWHSLLSVMRLYVFKNYSDLDDKARVILYSAIHGFSQYHDEIAANQMLAKYKSDYVCLKNSKTWVKTMPARFQVLLGVIGLSAVYKIVTKPRLLKFLVPLLSTWSLYKIYGNDIILLYDYLVSVCRKFYGLYSQQVTIRQRLISLLQPKCCVTILDERPIATQGVETPAIEEQGRNSRKGDVDQSLCLSEIISQPDVDLTPLPFVIQPVDDIYVSTRIASIFETITKPADTTIDISLCIGKHTPHNYVSSFTIECKLVNGAMPFSKIQSIKNYESLKTVHDMHKPEKPPTMSYLIGPCWLDVIPAAFMNSSINEYASMCGRHLNYDHSDLLGLWPEAVSVSIDLFRPMVLSAPSYTLDTWLLDQPPIKRIRYKNFVNELNDMNFANPKYHARNFFLKDEMLVPPFEGDLRDKFPRGIQGMANPCTNMALGPFMHVVSSALAANYGGPLSYTSQRTPEEIGDWYQQCYNDGFTFYEDDFSAYDSSQGAGAHWAEVEIYKLFKPDQVVLYALEQQKYTTGYGNYFKYKTPYTRKSGDQNTSIGNTIINMIAHVWAINSYNKRGNSVIYRMMALGDDNLLAVKNAGDDFAQYINKQISLLGLQPKFFKSSFAPTYCSSVFLPVLDEKGYERYVLVPEVLRRITKIGWTVTNVKNQETVLGRLKANEVSQPNNSLMPVSRVFSNHYGAMNVTMSRLDKWQNHSKYDSDYVFGDNTKEWFMSVYGVPWSSVVQLETFLYDHLSACGSTPSFWSHHVASEMYTNYNSSNASRETPKALIKLARSITTITNYGQIKNPKRQEGQITKKKPIYGTKTASSSSAKVPRDF